MNVLDLFSGIGGFSLGLERAGMRTVAFCEIEPYCRAVLERHWPGVPIFGDIRDVTGEAVSGATRAEIINVVCGGFPCQPFSSATRGRGRGKADDRYLWPQMLRVISEIQPSWVVGENVAHLEGVALEQVVSDLESEGYEVQTFDIPACAVEHDHRRQRLWICGYADRNRKPSRAVHAKASRMSGHRHEAGHARVPHGISGGMDAHRKRALGNAVVPQIPEIIGRAIMQAEGLA